MPVQNQLQQRQSRAQLTRLFNTAFPGTDLVDDNALGVFLQQHDLGCFINSEALLKPIITRDERGTQFQLFCLPSSANISADFIEKLSRFIPQSLCPVFIYWSWQISENENCVALRISLMRQQESCKTIQFDVEILNPIVHHFFVSPIEQFINDLKIQLRDYQFFPKQPFAAMSEPLVGDTRYWSALSLFLRLIQDADGYRTDFVAWQEKNKSIQRKMLTYVDPLLNAAPLVHAPLFYGEQCAAILKMICAQKIDSPWISLLDKNTDFFRILRASVLCYVSYTAWDMNDYAMLVHIPLVLGFQLLTSFLNKKSLGGLAQIVLFYFCHLMMAGSTTAFHFYMRMPGTPTQRTIVASRYIFQWVQEMIKEMLKLFIRFPSMMLCFFCFEKMLDQKTMQLPENQAGLLAIAVLMVQFMISWIGGYLFEYKNWEMAQNAEEQVLNFIDQTCREPCHLTIKSALPMRLVQQAFCSEQEIQFSMGSPSATTECALRISGNTTSKCSDYQLACTSRFFTKVIDAASEAATLVVEPVKQLFNSSFKYCSS